MKWLDGNTDSTDMISEQTLGDSEGQGSLACCSPWSHRVGDNLATEQQQQHIIFPMWLELYFSNFDLIVMHTRF